MAKGKPASMQVTRRSSLFAYKLGEQLTALHREGQLALVAALSGYTFSMTETPTNERKRKKKGERNMHKENNKFTM